MTVLFDEVASKFANDIDSAIVDGSYVRGRLFVELARQSIPTDSYVLDYGCGPGRLSLLLAQLGLRVRGVDTSDGMIEQASRLERSGLDLEFEAISDFAQALLPNSYDAIVCSSVIEYVADAGGLLRAFRAALRKQGTLIISYANKSSLSRRRWHRRGAANPMGPAQHHVWDRAGFESLLEQNGFRPICRPKFFESPSDNRIWGELLRHVPYAGTLGVLAAQPL